MKPLRWLAVSAAVPPPSHARAEVSEVRIAKQPGINYPGPIVMEQQESCFLRSGRAAGELT